MSSFTEACTNFIKNPAVKVATNATVNAVFGFMIGRVFTVVSPFHAALFCATTAIVKDLADSEKSIFKRDAFFRGDKNQDLAFIANRCGCVLLSCAVVHLTGAHLYFGTGMLLWLSVSLIKAVWDDVVVSRARSEWKKYSQ